MSVALKKSAGQTFVLSGKGAAAHKYDSFHGKVVSTPEELKRLLKRANRKSLWVSYDGGLISELLRSLTWPAPSLGEAVLTHHVSSQTLAAIANCFQRYSVAETWLPPEELGEVLSAENRADLFVGGSVDHQSKTMTLIRGGGKKRSITVPFSAFEPSGAGVQPDFHQMAITDYGQTLRLGSYEAATDAVLYEFDPDYRRRIHRERKLSERSFGASLRRLRIQKGLRREDFAPVSAKTVARIEQGAVKRVQAKTLQALASRLNVPPEEIETF